MSISGICGVSPSGVQYLVRKEFAPNGLAQDVEQKSKILSSLGRILIFVGTPLVVFAAARNTITWHCQRFWGASADFWQFQWDKILDTIGEDPITLWVCCPIVVSFVVFWFFGGLYTLLDLTNTPAALMRYKTQPGINEPVDSKRLLKVIFYVMFNQTFIAIPIAFLHMYVMEWRGYPSFRELPTFHWVLFQLAILILIEEIGFYYTHRMLHSKFLYKYVHKKHHEWTAPIAITALYAHPIEHVFSNLFPAFVGICITGAHVATAYLWFSLAVLATLHSHCGYHLPFLPSPEFHDYHHLKFNQCFGVLGILDRIHGTDAKFRETIYNSRHIVTVNFISPREMFPDPEPKYHKGK